MSNNNNMSTTVKCSKLKKADCAKESTCKWEIGKGCTTATTPAPPLSQSPIIVFSGFRDADMKDQVVANMGATVTHTFRDDATLVVFVPTDANREHLAETTIPTISLEDFCEQHSFVSTRVRSSPTHLPTIALPRDTKPLPVRIPAPGDPPIPYNPFVFIDEIEIDLDHLWTQIRHMTHSVYDKIFTRTRKVERALYLNTVSGRFAVALYHTSHDVDDEWDLSLVEFTYKPSNHAATPHTPKAFSFSHILLPLAHSVRHDPPSSADIALLHANLVHLFDIPLPAYIV
jgi:hypothetical protein